MKKRKVFMQAIRILAPEDQFTQAQQAIPGEKRPLVLGGMALEFVAAVQKAPESDNELPAMPIIDQPTSTNNHVSISHAIRIKSAEYWLKLGEADQALKELEELPSRSWRHGWALRTRIVAMGGLRESKSATI